MMLVQSVQHSLMGNVDTIFEDCVIKMSPSFAADISVHDQLHDFMSLIQDFWGLIPK